MLRCATAMKRLILILLLLCDGGAQAATCYWVGADSSWDTASNWSSSTGGSGSTCDGGTVPSSNDAVIFDGADTTSCTADAAINIASINVQSGYSGTLDFANSSYTHTISGNVTVAGTGTIDYGDSTITSGGSWDQRKQTTIDPGTSHVHLTGSGKSLNSDAAEKFYDLTIDSGASYSGGFARIYVKNSYRLEAGATMLAKSLESDDGVTFTIDGEHTDNNTTSTTQLARRVTLDGSGVYTSIGRQLMFLGSSSSPDDTTTVAATADLTIGAPVAVFNQFVSDYATLTIESGGAITFTSDVNLTPNQNTLTINGELNLSGANDQELELSSVIADDVVINKSAGTVTLVSSASVEDVTLADGTIDIDGNDITTTGDFTQAANTTVQDTTGGGLITVGGNLDGNGTSGNEIVWNGPDLDVTGTAVMEYCTATDSDASAGTEITCTTGCADGTGNSNWDFGGAPAPSAPTQVIIIGQCPANDPFFDLTKAAL
jgi:hypothetical protein